MDGKPVDQIQSENKSKEKALNTTPAEDHSIGEKITLLFPLFVAAAGAIHWDSRRIWEQYVFLPVHNSDAADEIGLSVLTLVILLFMGTACVLQSLSRKQASNKSSSNGQASKKTDKSNLLIGVFAWGILFLTLLVICCAPYVTKNGLYVSSEMWIGMNSVMFFMILLLWRLESVTSFPDSTRESYKEDTEALTYRAVIFVVGTAIFVGLSHVTPASADSTCILKKLLGVVLGVIGAQSLFEHFVPTIGRKPIEEADRRKHERINNKIHKLQNKKGQISEKIGKLQGTDKRTLKKIERSKPKTNGSTKSSGDSKPSRNSSTRVYTGSGDGKPIISGSRKIKSPAP